jgi:syntaxin 16
MESETDRSFSQSTLLQTAQKKQHTSIHDALISQREREIEDIAQGIIELANIFQDLQTMVIDQGSMLDRIDYNVERMATDVKEADKELTVATGYQKRTTKRKIILLLILVVVALFILLMLKPSRRSSQPPPDPAPDAPPKPDTPEHEQPPRVSALKSRQHWRVRKRRRKAAARAGEVLNNVF